MNFKKLAAERNESVSELNDTIRPFRTGKNMQTGTNVVRTYRGSISKASTKVLKEWLYDHRHSAYPNDEEKLFLAQETNLSVLQVNNWFVNARRRILPRLELDERYPLRYTVSRKESTLDNGSIQNTDEPYATEIDKDASIGGKRICLDYDCDKTVDLPSHSNHNSDEGTSGGYETGSSSSDDEQKFIPWQDVLRYGLPGDLEHTTSGRINEEAKVDSDGGWSSQHRQPGNLHHLSHSLPAVDPQIQVMPTILLRPFLPWSLTYTSQNKNMVDNL